VEKKEENFYDILNKDYKGQFVYKELSKIYRTSSKKLRQLMEDYRLDLFMKPFSIEKLENWRKKIHEYTDEKLEGFKSHIEQNLDEIKKNEPLILFRKRSEVLSSSSIAHQKNLKHKLRLGNLPVCVLPEYGTLFCDIDKDRISREEFDKIVNDKKEIINKNWPDFNKENIWKNCIEGTESTDNEFDLAELKKVLSRSYPPDEFILQDLSLTGPILGTIHASKGREADDVQLYAPEIFNYKKEEENEKKKEIDEESRVLFVGISRAKKNLKIGNGLFRSFNSKSLKKSHRAFVVWRDIKKPGFSGGVYTLKSASVEFGLARDLDEFSFANERSQEFLRNQCITDWPIEVNLLKGDANIHWSYKIFPVIQESFVLGHFSQYFAKELNEVSKRTNRKGEWFIPRKNINNVFIAGVRTFTAEDKDSLKLSSSRVEEPFKTTGIWLVPIIRGFASMTFSPKRNKWRT